MDKTREQKKLPAVRQGAQKEAVLAQLRRIPIVQVACEKAGVNRATFYRMRNEDGIFRSAIDEAVGEGVAFISDVSESQLISLIKEKKWPAISFWLKNHHPKYGNKLEVTANLKASEKELTPEQKALVQKALELALLPKISPEENNLSKSDE